MLTGAPSGWTRPLKPFNYCHEWCHAYRRDEGGCVTVGFSQSAKVWSARCQAPKNTAIIGSTVMAARHGNLCSPTDCIIGAVYDWGRERKGRIIWEGQVMVRNTRSWVQSSTFPWIWHPCCDTLHVSLFLKTGRRIFLLIIMYSGTPFSL